MAKFLILIAATCVTALALLVIRQQQILAVHDMARTYEETQDHEEMLWDLRAGIHDQLNIESVHAMVFDFEREFGLDLIPFMLEACLDPTQPARASAGTSDQRLSAAPDVAGAPIAD